MILTEIRTEAEYEFLKLWYSCKWMIWDKFPESIFMVRGEKVLFEQDWKSKYLWCKHSDVWSFFESKFGYDYLQIKEIISSVLKEHLNKGLLTPSINDDLMPYADGTTIFYEVEQQIKAGNLKPVKNLSYCSEILKQHIKNINA